MSKVRAFFVLLMGINLGLDIMLITFGTNKWPWLFIDVILTILLFTFQTGKYVKDE